MSGSVSINDLLQDTRARVYLIWAFVVGTGFVATHFYQNPNINIVWTILSVIGLGYMYKVMPLGVNQMKRIFLAWLVPISIGMIASVASASTDIWPELVGYLGPFWLMVMSIGYIWNGLVDRPAFWYFIVALINVVGAILIYINESLLADQYLLAAILSVFSMLLLWVYRSEV